MFCEHDFYFCLFEETHISLMHSWFVSLVKQLAKFFVTLW